MRRFFRNCFLVLVALVLVPFDVLGRLGPATGEVLGTDAGAFVTALLNLLTPAHLWLREDGLVISILIGVILIAGWLLGHVLSDDDAGDGEAATPTPGMPRIVRGLVVEVEFTNTWVGTDPLFVVTVTHPSPAGMQTSVAPLATPPQRTPVRGGSVMVIPGSEPTEVSLAPDPSGLSDPDGVARYSAPTVWR